MIFCKSKAENIYDYHLIDLHSYVEPFSFEEETFQESLKKLALRHSSLIEVGTIAPDDIVCLDSDSVIEKFQKRTCPFVWEKVSLTKNSKKRLQDLKQEKKKLSSFLMAASM